jgi:hypothetical protein
LYIFDNAMGICSSFRIRVLQIPEFSRVSAVVLR